MITLPTVFIAFLVLFAGMSAVLFGCYVRASLGRKEAEIALKWHRDAEEEEANRRDLEETIRAIFRAEIKTEILIRGIPVDPLRQKHIDALNAILPLVEEFGKLSSSRFMQTEIDCKIQAAREAISELYTFTEVEG